MVYKWRRGDGSPGRQRRKALVALETRVIVLESEVAMLQGWLNIVDRRLEPICGAQLQTQECKGVLNQSAGLLDDRGRRGSMNSHYDLRNLIDV